jgi:polyferredoxin
MLYALMHRGIMELHVLHERNPLFVQLSNGDIRNSYTVKILNKTHQDRNYALSVDGLKDSTIKVMAADELDPKNLPVFADSVGQFRLQIIAPPNTQLKRQEITLNITDTNDGEKDDYSSIFVSGQ